ncbi:MAG: valine--tRNA ligase [Erysipelotrichaceae bacterium]|nr:valine--tRNA ligase [Erysipelotrichaceae bacterium]
MLEKRYDPKKVEEGKYDKWLEKGYFTAGDTSKKPYTIVIPPPNVTGKLHLGHTWDNTLQDIIARYKKMLGYDVLYLPGMDHAGIATQAKVMEKLYKNGVDVTKISREDFLKAAWGWKDEYAANIHNQWRTMGLMLDYSRERFTLDEGLNYAVRTVFVKLYNEGLIYQGERIINWDPVQQTALSNVEVIHKDDEGYMYYFKYPLTDGSGYLEVATTRPETMFGDVCVVVNPKDKRYINVIGKKVINPANGDELPIIGDEYVDVEFGTGAMKCTPAHDPNDFIIGEKYGFEKPIIFNKDATMNEKCGKYQGLDRFVCREELLKDIEKAGNFIKKEKIVHPVGHSERSDAVVEPMLSKQWFVKMKPLAEASLKNQKGKDKVNFVPSRFEKTFTNWMNNIEDWCISRQLWWGHRIPAYYNKHTGEVVVSIDPPKDMENYEQENDVLDTWFSSALWPFSTLGWPNQTEDFKRYFPTQCLVTGYDIIFFWVSRMIFQSLHMNNVRPFEDCLIHGLIRDEKGRKMSKTLGNGVDPMDVIAKYGADALRYFMTTNSTPGQDMRYIESRVEASSNYLNKIWNSARYVLSVLPEDFKEKPLNKKEFSLIDQWIINRLNETIEKVKRNMDKYDFNAASGHLYNFVYDDYCGQYLEMSKVSLNGNDESKKEVTYQILFKCLKDIILLIYPYTPFIGEELYQSLPIHLESIMLESYPVVDKKLVDKKGDKQVILLFDLIREVRNYKIENKLSPSLSLQIKINNHIDLFTDFATYFNRFTFSNVEFSKEDLSALKGELFIHDDADMIILSNENAGEIIERLEKELQKELEETNRCEKMLNNPSFIEKAPKEKVELEKNKLQVHRENIARIEEKLKKLK